MTTFGTIMALIGLLVLVVLTLFLGVLVIMGLTQIITYTVLREIEAFKAKKQ